VPEYQIKIDIYGEEIFDKNNKSTLAKLKRDIAKNIKIAP